MSCAQVLQVAQQQFSELYSRGEISNCLNLIDETQLLLLKNGLLEPKDGTDHDLLLIARTCLEKGAFCKIKAGDVSGFSRLAAQLQPFYSASYFPESESKSKIVGLMLLVLLAENRIANFHTFIEKFSEQAIENDVFLKWVVLLESSIMEGSFDCARKIIQQPPCEEYLAFVPVVMNMIRKEIADCMEKAYQNLPLESCAALLFLEDLTMLEQIFKEKGWGIEDGIVYFAKNSINSSKESDSQPVVLKENLEKESSIILFNVLKYAEELEQII